MHRLAALLMLTACYRTVVRPAGTQEGAVGRDRQVFTIGGLVPLSGAAGNECGPSGLAWSESQMDVTDVLIYIGLSVAGGIIGAAACPGGGTASGDDARQYAACTAGLGALLPLIISTRTVTYACNGNGPPLLPAPGR